MTDSFQLKEGQLYLLKNGYKVRFKKNCPAIRYSWGVVEVDGKPDNLYKERFREDGIGYHDDCGYKVVAELKG